ncbi:hypothetical protein [Nocardia brasiliensis]|uniref:hypothetical protein n=1 Tax=Nocardia brasiliensis TaxID=37326 RepID=UPI0024583465|nr:hypothetical protein [Nocardia brasiliensis]
MAWVLIMDCEDGFFQVHSWETEADAIADRVDCMNDGGYPTTKPFHMPDNTDWSAYEEEIQGGRFNFGFPT